MRPVLQYLATMTGWHEFAEFTAEDVGTLDSGTCLENRNHAGIATPASRAAWTCLGCDIHADYVCSLQHVLLCLVGLLQTGL